MHQHRAPFDMPQEVQPQAATFGGARNQAGHIGDGERVLPRRHHAEIRRQRGERIVGDLRLGRRDGRHQRRLARRRKPDQADVGDRLEFQGQVARLALLTEQREAGRLAGARGQCRVAQSTAPARSGFEPGAGPDQVGQQPAVFVEHDGAVGDLDFEVCARGAVAVAAHALLARRGHDMGVEVEIEQGVHLRVDDQHDAAAASAVAAVGAAEWFEFLPVDRGAAVTAVARPRVDHDAVDKPGHRTSFPTPRTNVFAEELREPSCKTSISTRN